MDRASYVLHENVVAVCMGALDYDIISLFLAIEDRCLIIR